ncbi:MAG: tail fiber protein [Deltaproteobacteria bacterium]
MSYLLGLIKVFPFNDQPDHPDLTLCDGRLLKVNDNPALFSLIGTKFGGGSYEFRIPDLRGAEPDRGGNCKYYICVRGYFEEAEFYTGQIELFPDLDRSFPPGWMPCNGQSLNKDEYRPIFEIIKYTFGGDGQNLFNLPNLQGTQPIPKTNYYIFVGPGYTGLGKNQMNP